MQPTTTCYIVSGIINNSAQQMRVMWATAGSEPAKWENYTFTFIWRVTQQSHQQPSTVKSVLNEMNNYVLNNNMEIKVVLVHKPNETK